MKTRNIISILLFTFVCVLCLTSCNSDTDGVGHVAGTLSRDYINKCPSLDDPIVGIKFVSTLKDAGKESWDVSEEQNNKVKAWFNETPDGLELVIGAKGIISLPEDSSGLFAYEQHLYDFCPHNFLKYISFGASVDTSKVTNMSNMFAKCNSLKELDLSGFDTSNATNMERMFWCCSLSDIDLSNFNTSCVTNMKGMFEGSSIKSIDLSSFDTANVRDMSYMFDSCDSIVNIDISSLNTSKLANTERMFAGCEKLRSINLKGINTSNVTNMHGMFVSCLKLESLDLTTFDTSNVETMSGMFCDCECLQGIDLSSFKTSNVTDMSQMFADSGLVSIDLSGFNISDGTDLSKMFDCCFDLKYASFSYPSSCYDDRIIDCTHVKRSVSDDIVMIFGEKDIPSEFQTGNNKPQEPLNQAITSGICGENLTWTLDEDGVLTVSGSGEMYDWDTPFSSAIRAVRSPFFEYKDEIYHIVLEDGIVGIGDYAFAECQKLSYVEIPQTITRIGNGAFKNCKQISSINIPNAVTQIGDEAFFYCQKMSGVDIPSSVTSIGINAFDSCSLLTSITIPSGVKYIGKYTFNNCTNLATVTFNDGVLSLGQGAFYNCSHLTSIDLPDSVTEIGYEAFYGCKGLTSIDIPASVTKIDYSAFRKCSNSLIFHVESGSVAEDYAKRCGFVFASDNTITELDKETEVLSSLCNVGDYVTFGTYPQTATGDDNTPIEWLVLARDNQNVLLLSRYGLDTQRYNKKDKAVTWEECTLRTWLNDTFFKKAFTAKEQQSIMTTDVDNSHSQCSNNFKTNGGNDTQDKLFLLSCSEANTYLGVTYLDNQVSARVSPTEYAIKQGAYTHEGNITIEGKDACTWWLRSPGSSLWKADSVSHSGSFPMNNYAVDYDGICVRPVCWVNLESLSN